MYPENRRPSLFSFRQEAIKRNLTLPSFDYDLAEWEREMNESFDEPKIVALYPVPTVGPTARRNRRHA